MAIRATSKPSRERSPRVPVTGRRLLDLRCGTGTLLREFAERHGALVAEVDSSSAMVDQARRQLPAGSSAHVAQAEDLPFASCSFGAAVASMSHHFDRGRAFAEVSCAHARRRVTYAIKSPGSTLDFQAFVQNAAPGTAFYADDAAIVLG